MLYRLLIVVIISFWVLMNGTLLRLWLDPTSSKLLTVPIEHIAKQAFEFEKTTDLTVYQGNKSIGRVALSPRSFNSEGLCKLEFNGNLFLELPFISQQPYAWRGKSTLDRQFALQTLDLEINITFPKTVILVNIDLPNKKATWSLEQGEEPRVENTLPLDKTGFAAVLTALGIDPGILSQVAQSAQHAAGANANFLLQAQKTEIRIHDAPVQAYRVTLTQGGSTPLLESDITLLGQIVSIKTAFGIQLLHEE